MKQLNLPARPNIEFETQQNGVNFRLKIYAVSTGVLMVDIYADNTPVITGVLCQAKTPLIDFNYLAKNGNFIFVTDEKGSYPDWRNFPDKHKFYYLEPEEQYNGL